MIRFSPPGALCDGAVSAPRRPFFSEKTQAAREVSVPVSRLTDRETHETARKPLPRPRTIAGEQLRRYAMEGLVNQLEQGLTPLEVLSLLGARPAAGRSPNDANGNSRAAAKVVTAIVTNSDEAKMSEFDKLLNDLAAAQRQRTAPRRTAPPARALALPRMRADKNFAKAMDAQLSQMEGASQTQSIQMQQAALGARIEDIRARARQAIDRAMAEIKELIPQGRITPVEVAERQILLDAFARRMGL